MKRLSWLCATLLLLVGCNGQANEELEQQEEDEVVIEEAEEDNEQIEEESELTEESIVAVEGEQEEPEPVYEINENSAVVPIDEADEQVVLLTIDDAPDQRAVEMAETLREMNAEAIFFVNGHFILDQEGEEKLKAIYDMGFEIGNHTMSHPDLTEISAEQTREEIIELNDRIEDIIGERPRFFRAPYGKYSDLSKEIIEEEAMTFMNWTYGYDWESEYQSADSLADIMVNTELLANGGNLLMHDRDWTADALQDIVNGLREKGYHFVDPREIK